MNTVNVNEPVNGNDKGPAFEQINIPGGQGESNSGVLLSDINENLFEKVQHVVNEITDNGSVSRDRRGNITIPWPTRDNNPVSEFTTHYFFTMAFPALFPDAKADFHSNRPRTCQSMTEWADHLLWFKDGRFVHHPYFKFVVHPKYCCQ